MSLELIALAVVGLAVFFGLAAAALAVVYWLTRPGPPAPTAVVTLARSDDEFVADAFQTLDQVTSRAAYKKLGRNYVENGSARRAVEFAGDFRSPGADPAAAPKAP